MCGKFTALLSAIFWAVARKLSAGLAEVGVSAPVVFAATTLAEYNLPASTNAPL